MEFPGESLPFFSAKVENIFRFCYKRKVYLVIVKMKVGKKSFPVEFQRSFFTGLIEIR
jgi:hypothetical protein